MQSTTTRRAPAVAPIDLSERHVATLGGARAKSGAINLSPDHAYRLHFKGAWDGGRATVNAYRDRDTVAIYSATFSKHASVVLPPGTSRITLAAPADAPKTMRVLVTLETLDGPIPDAVELHFRKLRDGTSDRDSVIRRLEKQNAQQR